MDNQQEPLPEPGTWWRHKNGSRYKVIMITNQHSKLPDKYPVTIVYAGENGHDWSRPLKYWHGNMTPETPHVDR